MYVFDATPLIYLAKIDRLPLTHHLDDPLIIPERVFQEVVVEGSAAGYPDARRIERAVESNRFERRAAPKSETWWRLQANPRVSDADVAVLVLAAATGGVGVMDEQYGRDLARAENIETRGTAWIVLTAYDCGELSQREATNAIDALLDAGWYCSPDLYAAIRRKIE